jgi:hypothetical protein
VATATGLRQIQLLVSSTNEPARHLYESLGFRCYGREIEALCIAGEFHDADLMARFFQVLPASAVTLDITLQRPPRLDLSSGCPAYWQCVRQISRFVMKARAARRARVPALSHRQIRSNLTIPILQVNLFSP